MNHKLPHQRHPILFWTSGVIGAIPLATIFHSACLLIPQGIGTFIVGWFFTQTLKETGYLCRHILGHNPWPYEGDSEQPIPIATSSTTIIKCRRCGQTYPLS